MRAKWTKTRVAAVRYNICAVGVFQTKAMTFGVLALVILAAHRSDRRSAADALPVQETFSKACNEFTKPASVQYASQFGVVV